MHRNSPRNLQTRARQGMYAMLPLLPGIVPFGLIAGFTPVSFGYTWIDSTMGSLLMFAGASQLAAYQLMDEGASLLVILMTVTAINLRYVLYSASIAPYLANANRASRLLAGYGLTDQIFAICQRDYPTHDWNLNERMAYYGGGTLVLWLLWQLCTMAGALVGQVIPVFWSLEFMIPLTFLALALNTLKTNAHRVTALTGAGVSFLGLELPYNLGLMLGSLLGMLAGVLYKRFSR